MKVCVHDFKPFLDRNHDQDRKFSPLLRQILVATGPIILLINAGAVAGYSAVALPQMRADNSTIRINDEDASWIASIMVLPMPIGCILGGILMEKYGRWSTHLMACLPLLIGWGIISLSTTIEMLLTGRLLAGFCNGFLGPISSVYISETSEPRYRGFLLTTIMLAIAVGILIEHVLGTFMTWQTTCLICGAMPCIAALFMCYTPESPSWLIKKHRLEEAIRCYYWCRGYSMEAKKELQELLENQAKSPQNKRPMKETIKGLLSKEFLKPLAILIVFFTTTQWSGMNAIAFYSINFIRSSVGNNFNAYTAMIMIDVLRLIVSIGACVLTKFYGRRPIVIASGFGTAASLFALCGFMSLTKSYPELDKYNAFILVCLITYTGFLSIGLAPLCWTVNGELFPLSLRSYGSAITSSYTFLVFFSVVKSVHWLFDVLGINGTFMVYGSVSLIGTGILAFVLPETKDRTLILSFLPVTDSDRAADLNKLCGHDDGFSGDRSTATTK